MFLCIYIFLFFKKINPLCSEIYFAEVYRVNRRSLACTDKNVIQIKKLKIKIMKNHIILSLLIVLFFSACREDVNEIITTNESPDPDIEIINPEPTVLLNSSVIGTVIGENNLAVEGATVSLNAQTVTTDENGVFIFRNKQMDSKKTYVTVQKEGYFPGSRTFIPFENSFSHVRIKLMSNTPNASISDATTGGEASFQNGTKLVFPDNSVVLTDGTPYTGTIHIAAQFLDPTSDDVYERMPGDLRGINNNQNQVALQTMGMLAVELTNDNGERLEVAAGKTVELTIPLDASLLATAPETIPLWYFDEANGYWVEDGSATLQGNAYVGEVSHFSFWNCDIPKDYAYIEGRVVDESGTGLSGLEVAITSEYSGVGYGTTDDNGQFGGIVPASEVLDILIESSDCIVYTGQIPPLNYLETNMLDDIVVALEDIETLTIFGNIECDSNPVTNGYVSINQVGSNNNILGPIPINSDGSLYQEFLVCGNVLSEVEVIAYDFDNEMRGLLSSFSIVNNMIDIGNLSACEDEFETYFNFSIDGVDYFTTSTWEASFAPVAVFLIGGYGLAEGGIELIIDDDVNSTGTYNVVSVRIIKSFEDFEYITYRNLSSMNTGDVTVNITEYNNTSGELIKGTFEGTTTLEGYTNGTVVDILDNPVLEGSFSLIRQ